MVRRMLSVLALLVFAPFSFAIDPGILVVGTGSVSVKPTSCRITAVVVSVTPAAGDSLRGSNSTMAKIRESLTSLKIAADDIKTSELDFRALYFKRNNDEEETKLRGYRTENTITVTVRDLSQLSKVMDTMVNAGATRISRLTFSADYAAARKEALRMAMENAKAKAETMALASGTTIGTPIAVSESFGDFGVYHDGWVENLRESNTDGKPSTSPGMQQVTATITVRFFIKRPEAAKPNN